MAWGPPEHGRKPVGRRGSCQVSHYLPPRPEVQSAGWMDPNSASLSLIQPMSRLNPSSTPIRGLQPKSAFALSRLLTKTGWSPGRQSSKEQASLPLKLRFSISTSSLSESVFPGPPPMLYARPAVISIRSTAAAYAAIRSSTYNTSLTCLPSPDRKEHTSELQSPCNLV